MSHQFRKPQTTRTFTSTTFTKAIAVRPFYNIHGVDTSKKWASQRIQNEASALAYIQKNTTIPVPRVIETGEGENGTYLTVERLDGIELGDIGVECRLLPVYGYLLDGHQDKKCSACQAIANENAATYIRDTMLPQLASLRSNVSGLNGYVIPPPWVAERDRRESWKPRTSDNPGFIFCHNDLGPQNLLMHRTTLEVIAVVDWENAGFYDEEFLGFWAVNRDSYLDMYSDDAGIARLISLLEKK